MNYYPSYVYHPREDITRLNMREYDIKHDNYLRIVEQKEKEIGRNLDLKERYEISKSCGL